jgi:protease I
MERKRLDGMRVAVIANEWFEQSEMEEPRKALDAAGAETVLISTKGGEIQARLQGEKGARFPVDMTLDEARASDFDAVLLPGGTLNADKLRMDERARGFVREMQSAGKPIAAICHAPWLLVSAGLVKGRTLTSFYTLQDDIRNAGGTWQDQPVVRDRNWVTSRQPSDIPEFNRATLELFTEAVPAKAAR